MFHQDPHYITKAYFFLSFRSQDVPETSSDLDLGRTVLAAVLSSVELGVLPLEVVVSGSGGKDGSSGSGAVDRETENESWAIVLVEIGSPNIRGVAERVDERVNNSSLDGRTGDRTGDPGQDNDGGGVETGGKDHHGDVTSGSVGSCQSDDIADNGDEEGKGNVEPSFLLLVRVPTVDEEDNTTNKVWRSGNGEGDSSGEAETSDDNGEKVGNRGGDVVALQDGTQQPGLGVGDGSPKTGHDARLIGCILGTTVALETVEKLLLLEGSEPSDVLRRVGNDKSEDDGTSDSKTSFSGY